MDMIFRKKHLVVLLLMLFVSCEGNSNEPYIRYTPIIDLDSQYMSFKEEMTIIEIDKDTKSFRLEGTFTGDIDFDDTAALDIFRIAADSTTAKHKVHFFNDVDANVVYDREKLEWFLDVELFPAEITSEIQIGYYIDFFTLSNDVPTPETIIKIIPKK